MLHLPTRRVCRYKIDGMYVSAVHTTVYISCTDGTNLDALPEAHLQDFVTNYERNEKTSFLSKLFLGQLLEERKAINSSPSMNAISNIFRSGHDLEGWIGNRII